MGEYIGYVWTAYGIALFILAAVTLATLCRHRNLKKQERNINHQDTKTPSNFK